MKRWKSSVVFLASLLLCFGMMWQPMQAEAAYGEISAYTPNVLVGYKDTRLTLDNTYIGVYKQNSDSIESDYINATYEGTLYLNPEVIMDSSCYYNGYFSFDLVLSSDQASNLYFNASCDMDNIDGIHCVMEVRENSANSSTFRFTFEFSEFYCNNSYMRFPLQVDVSTTLTWDATLTDLPSQIVCTMYSGNVNSSMYKFTDLRDMKTTNGTFANQNQQIIDGIDENTGVIEDLINNLTTWFSDLKSNINTRFSELTSNLTAWYNGITETINSNFDKLLNNYDSSAGEEKNEEFAAGSDELVSIEGDLSDTSNTNIDNYTTTAFDTSIISTLGPSLLYVVTWFTNFWEMGGLFTSLLNVGLALYIAFYILRLRGR